MEAEEEEVKAAKTKKTTEEKEGEADEEVKAANTEGTTEK